jgi:hypothetical protein
MGGTQFVGTTAHATGYLVVADTTHPFLLKKRELIKKTFIVFGLFMLWSSDTNFSTHHFTRAAGYFFGGQNL